MTGSLPGRAQKGTPGGARRQKGLCGFNLGGHAFALTSGGGVVKVFDSATGDLRHTVGLGDSKIDDAGHLEADYRALAWASSTAKTPSKKKTKGVSKVSSALLVLGSANGDVVGWDVSLGEMTWRAASCHVGEVSALAFSPATGVVYSVGGDATVCELRAATGELQHKWKAGKHALAAVAVSPDGARLLAASAGLAVWDLASREKVGKLSGHAVPAHTVAFAPDGARAVSAAPAERHVAVWDIDAAAAGGKGAKGALAVLNMEHPAVQLATAAAVDAAEFHVVAVSEVGEAYVWRCGPKGAAAASFRVRVALPAGVKASAAGECVLAAAHSGARSLTVVRGSLARPTFETLEGAADGAVVELKAAEQDGVLLESTPKAAAKANKLVNVVAAEAAPDHLRGVVAGTAAEKRRKRAAQEENGGEVAATTVAHAADMATDEEEATLGDRLAALGMEGAEATHTADAQGRHRRGGGDGAEPAPKADSLGVLLSQAVRAGDQNLLERCLNVAEEAVVRRTVTVLPPQDALALVEALLVRLQSRPGRAPQLARWLRAVLLAHPAYLMSAPAARPHLATLYQILEARLALLKPLTSLAGRLDFLLAQQQQAAAAAAGGAAAAAAAGEGPLVDYIEPESAAEGAVAVEDPFAPAEDGEEGSDSDGEGEWETDDGEGSDMDEDDDDDGDDDDL